MLKGELNLIEACDKAMAVVSRIQELNQLYREAVQAVGEGELRTGILELAMEALTDEQLKEEVFSSGESMLSFFCGIWIQFLLVEIAGIRKDELRALASKAFQEIHEKHALH